MLINNIEDFNKVRYTAELKALAKHSLLHPLNDKQFERMMELKKQLFGEQKDEY